MFTSVVVPLEGLPSPRIPANCRALDTLCAALSVRNRCAQYTWEHAETDSGDLYTLILENYETLMIIQKAEDGTIEVTEPDGVKTILRGAPLAFVLGQLEEMVRQAYAA